MSLLRGRKIAERLSAGLQRINPRERMLLGAAALGVLLFAPVKAYDWLKSAEAANVRARVDLVSAQEAAAAGQGPLRRRIAQAQSDVRDWSWSAPSLAAGQVVLADAVNDVASDAGLAEAQVKASEPPTRVGEVYMAKVDVQSAYDPASLVKFIRGLDDTGNGFLIEALNIQAGGGAPKLKLTLDLPLSLQASRAP